MKIKNEKALFQNALTDAYSQIYDRELLDSDENAQATEDHKLKIRQIINDSLRHEKQILVKKAIIGILVAALLLLIGCTAYIHRNTIGKYIEEFYDKHMKITVAHESNTSDMIAVYYAPTYIPDGYSANKELYTTAGSYYRWSNSEGQAITFEQYPPSRINHLLDSESGETTIWIYENIEIYRRENGASHTYIWSNNNGSFKMVLSSDLPEGEVCLIINSMTAK